MALFRALLHEWQLVRHNKAVMLVLFGGILFYFMLFCTRCLICTMWQGSKPWWCSMKIKPPFHEP